MDRQTPESIGAAFCSLPSAFAAVSIVGEVVRCFAVFSISIVNDGE
jgi:hypothetical protein